MWILVLCVLLNSLLGIIFKIFSKYDVEIFPAIVINYFVAIITAWLYLGASPIPTDIWQLDWFPYALVLGVLFITFFNITAHAVDKAGLVVTTVFQKMSLIAPAAMGIFWFHESGSLLKILGIVLALLAILLVTYSKKAAEKKLPRAHLILAILVLIGSAIIDGLLYWVDVKGLVSGNRIQFVTFPFLVSGTIGVFILLFRWIKEKRTIQRNSIIAGIVLGVPNFFSIYLILTSLSIGIEGSVVFPVNNIGILLLSALFGIFVFKESINVNKIIGFALSILAIFLISHG